MSIEHPSSRAAAARRVMRAWRGALAFVAVVTWSLLAVPACAQSSAGLADLAPLLPTMACADVVKMDLSGVTDGTVTIQSATVVTNVGPEPYCDVRGTISPANLIAVRLPTQGWTQRYVEVGCGGLCGMLSVPVNPTMAAACVPILNAQTALATTNMGHSGGNDGSWAAGNPQAQIDFAYRSMHALAQVSKAMITKFYGQAPRYSYFDGCSDGGREALMEAQRYPNDFDGIAAGAPANDLVIQNTYHHGWNAVANIDASGKYTLVASKLPLIHQAAINACDAIDGVTDGIIDDPRRCSFDPGTMLCASGQDPSTCLSAAEIAVVRRIHDGPTDAWGRHLEQPIAHEWGSELDWSLFIPTTTAGPSGSLNFVLPFLRYLTFYNQALPNYQITDLKFTLPYFYGDVETSHYWSATDPDLGAFNAHGGKLLLWHGWGDQHITPQGTIAYYKGMQSLMGAATVDNFAKLFLFPGVAHCGGGLGPNTFDILTPVMAWVETGTVPTSVVASIVSGGTTTRTRPVYPYPQVARYIGNGSTDVAANFAPFTPPTEPAVSYDWVGAPMYSAGYESQCVATGSTLSCSGGKPFPWEGTTGGPNWSLSKP